MLNTFVKNHKIEATIFLAAFVLRIILLLFNIVAVDMSVADAVHGDDGYFEMSQSILDGHGLAWEPGSPLFTANPLRPPLYPLILAFLLFVSGGSYLFTILVQIFVGSFIPVIAFYILKHFFDIEKYAYGIALLLALEPFTALLSVIFYTETFFLFLFFLFILYLFKYINTKERKHIFLAGLFMVLATLIKPTIQYFPFIIPIILLFHFRKALSKKLFLDMGVFVLVWCAFMAPVFYLNYKTFDAVAISAQPEFNLYIYLVPTVRAIRNDSTFGTELDHFLKEEGSDPFDIHPGNADEYKDRALEELIKYPKEIIVASSVSIFTFFSHDGLLGVLQHAGISVDLYHLKSSLLVLFSSPKDFIISILPVVMGPGILIFVARIFWIITALLAFLGLYKYTKEKRWNIKLFLAFFMVFYFGLTTMINGLGVNARFRVPVNIFILMFALSGIMLIREYLSHKKLFKDNEAINNNTCI